MSVVIKDDELELFKQNGVTNDQIAHTVNTYRQQGLSDDDIRSKVDVKLNSYRQAMQPQQLIQPEPQQDFKPVNGVISAGVEQNKFNIKDWWNNALKENEEYNNNLNEKSKLKAQEELDKRNEWEEKHPIISDLQKMYQPGYSANSKYLEQQAKYGLDVPINERMKNTFNQLKEDSRVGLNIGVDAYLFKGLGRPVFGGIRAGIAKLAKNPTTRNITRNALKSSSKFSKSNIGKHVKDIANLGKEGALYGAAHHGINNVYGVENENSLPMDMAENAGAFMAFGAGAKALGAGGKFAANKLNEKGGLLRNSKANLLKFKRSHPVASRRVDNVLSQINEAIAPGIERVGDTYYKGVNKLNKLRDKAFAYADDMLSNDQIAFAKKHGHVNAATEQGIAKEELRRINELKNTHNVNVDFDSIERSTYQRALNELTDRGLKESEARSILADNGMLDPELTNKNLDNVRMLNEKLGINPQEKTFEDWTQEQYDTFINMQTNSGVPKEAADEFLIDSGVQVEGKPISIETLNKVEQAIEEGKPITRESIYGEAGNKVLDDRYVKAVEEGVAPENLPEMVNRDLPEASPQGITNVPKEQPTQNNQVVQEQEDPFKLLDEIQNANKQPEPVEHDLSMDKSKLGINTPKEDLTHVNEPSVSSNNIETNIEQPKTKQANNQNTTNKSITKKPYKSQREKNMERANYKYLVTEDGSPINTKFGSRAKIKDNGTYKIDSEGNVVADRFGNPIKEKNVVPTAISGWENYPISKQPNWVEPKANRSSNITEGLGNKDADMLDVKLKSGKAEGSDTLNKFTDDKHENIYKNVKKEEVYTETTPSSYSKETIQNLKKNYELMPDGKTVVKKGKNKNTKLTKSELNKLKNDLQKEYDANEKYRFEEEYSDNTYDKYADKDIWEEGSEPNTIPEYVKPEDKDFNDFYNKFKLASEEKQEALLRSEFERRGGTKEAFNDLYKDVLAQTERDRILNDKPQLGKEAYKDTVSEDFFKQADKLGRTIEETPHVVKRKEIGEVSYKDRKKADLAWSYILKNNKTNPKIILTGTLNRYRGDITKAQAAYDKLFNKIKDSSYTGRTRDVMFDDLENAADKYENLHKNKIQRHKDISGEKVKANKVLDELKSADDLIGEKLMKDNKWVLKKTGNYNGNDVVSEHYAKRSVKRIAQIEDLANAQKAIERAKEKANKMSSKWKDKRLKYIEENPQEIIEDDLDKARKLWQRSKGFIKNTYTDYSLKEASTSYHGEYKKLGDTRSTELDDITKRDAAWKRVEAKVEGLLYGDMPNKIGKALEQGEGLKHYIGKTTTIGNLMQKFPKEFNAKLRKVFQNIKNKKVRVNESEYFKGSNTKDAITLSEGATFKTLKHEMGHENFSKSSLENSFVKEHYDENTEITHLYEDFINDNITTLDNIKGKFNGNFPSIEKALSSNKLSTEEKEVVKGLRNHYRLLKSSCEEQYCDMIADGSYTGSVERFVKTYNEVYPQWLEKVKATGVEGEEANARRLTKIIKERLQKPGRPSSKISRPDESFRDILREGRQIAETDVKREVEREVVKYNVDFDSNGVPDKPRPRTLGSRGLNDRGVIETLNKINDGEVAERVVKQLRENTLKRAGLLEAEQAAKAIEIQEGKGTVWIQSNVPSKTVKTTNTLGEDVNASKNSKAGAFGHRESGEIKYTTREDRLKDDFITAIRADSAHELASYAMKEYGIPLDKKVQGEYVPVNKKLLTQAIFLKNSKEWYQTIQEGDKAIEKVFKDKKVADYYKRLHETVQTPDCKMPKDVFDMLFDGSGENAATYIDRYWDMSFDHSTNFGNKARGVGRLMGGLIDGWNAGWKRNKLATLSFIVNNRLGNQMLLAAHGGKDYLTSLIDAAKMKDVDIPNEILSANIGEAFTDFLKKDPGQRISYTGYGIDKLFNLVNGTDLKIVNTEPIKKLKVKSKLPLNYSKKLPKGVKVARFKNPNDNAKTHFNNTASRLLNIAGYINNKWTAKAAQIINRVNNNFERFERKQAFSIVKKQYDRKKLKNFVGRSELYKAMAADINKCPEAKETILRGIEDMLGNYRTFSKFERNYLKRIKPFYSWDRTIIRTTLALTKKNPARAAWILYETKRLQNIQNDRKEYQQGSIDLPIKDERNKKQLLVNKREYGVPWSSLPRMDKKRWHEGFSSLFTAPYEGAIGHKLFLDKEFNDRRYFAVQTKDDKGKKHTQYYDKRTGKMLDKLPLAPRLWYVGKQLLADQIAPWTVNNLIKGDNLLGLIKADKNGNRTEYDTPYDTSFGGFRHDEAVGTATMKSKKGFPYKKVLKRMSAQNTAPTTKVLQRLGLGIQTKTPLSYYDKSQIKKEKEAEWRKKHKNKKGK